MRPNTLQLYVLRNALLIATVLVAPALAVNSFDPADRPARPLATPQPSATVVEKPISYSSVERTFYSFFIHSDLLEKLEQLDKEYEYILIDVAGRDSTIFREALLVSDTLIVPTQPSLLDLQVLDYMQEKVKTAKQTNENLKAYVLINRAAVRTTELKDAIEFIAEFDQFKLLKTVLFERKQFRDAIVESKSVTEMNASKAKDELNQLIIELL